MKKNHTPFQIACVTSIVEADKLLQSDGVEGGVWYMSSESMIWHGPAEDRSDLTRLKFTDSGNVYALMPPHRFRDLLRAHGYAMIEPKDQIEWAKAAKKPSPAKVFKPL